jgi:hypothetical protein
VWLQQECILFGLLKVSQACLELVAIVGMAARLFLQCIVEGENFHGLGVQGAKVSTLHCALPQWSMSPWFMEFTLSVPVSQSPFWILLESFNGNLLCLIMHLSISWIQFHGQETFMSILCC